MVNMVPPTTQMNLSVLKRYSPQTTAVVTTASYAVVYTFNTTTASWDRANIEGTLFIVALNNSNPYLSDKRKRGRRYNSNKSKDKEHAHAHTGPEEYQLIILSRRGLENFIIPLTSPDDIETSEKFVILRSSTKYGGVGTPSGETDDAITYGLWVWGEIDTVAGDRERIERIVRELSERVVKSKSRSASSSVQQKTTTAPVPPPQQQQKQKQQQQQQQQQPQQQPPQQPQQQQHPYEEENGDNSNSDDANGGGNGVGVGSGADIGGVPMTTRSISLTDLFNQQRKEDEGFSRHSHVHAQSNQSQPQHNMYLSHPQNPPQHHPQYQSQPSPHHHYQPPPHQPPPPLGPPPQHHPHHQYLPQSYESYYQSHQSQQPPPPQGNLQHLPPHHQLSHQRHSTSSSQSMPPPPNFLPTPALPAGQPSAYPTPPLPPGSASSRPQSQSQLPPVVNYHLGGYAPRMEYNGSGGGVGLGHANGGSDILRLFQNAAAAQSGGGGSSGGGGAGGTGGAGGY